MAQYLLAGIEFFCPTPHLYVPVQQCIGVLGVTSTPVPRKVVPAVSRDGVFKSAQFRDVADVHRRCFTGA